MPPLSPASLCLSRRDAQPTFSSASSIRRESLKQGEYFHNVSHSPLQRELPELFFFLLFSLLSINLSLMTDYFSDNIMQLSRRK